MERDPLKDVVYLMICLIIVAVIIGYGIYDMMGDK